MINACFLWCNKGYLPAGANIGANNASYPGISRHQQQDRQQDRPDYYFPDPFWYN
jgi:hypothetical protein